jgi:hypothetical protein
LNYYNNKKEMKEQDAAAAASTTPTQGGGTGYPQVTKWESGVTRGPANQIAVTKWKDVVGQSLKEERGTLYYNCIFIYCKLEKCIHRLT